MRLKTSGELGDLSPGRCLTDNVDALVQTFLGRIKELGKKKLAKFTFGTKYGSNVFFLTFSLINEKN